MRSIIGFSLFILLLTSCSKDYSNEIENYINANGLTGAQFTDEGLYYIINDPGAEEKPRIDDFVVVNYTGRLTDGTVFDSGLNKTFNLTKVIAGWSRGMRLFGKGGKGKIIIPPSLGYGDTSSGLIPANAILVFDIELLDFYE